MNLLHKLGFHEYKLLRAQSNTYGEWTDAFYRCPCGQTKVRRIRGLWHFDEILADNDPQKGGESKE